jgi:mRNA interferase HigB
VNVIPQGFPPVIAPRTLRAFWERHPQAEEPLKAWQKQAQKGDFLTFQALREPWPHADLVHTAAGIPVIVFNIGGNNYRLVVIIGWKHKTIFIKKVLTHAEYDEWNKKGRSV